MIGKKNFITGIMFLLVPAACIFLLDYVYRVYDQFDWGHPFTKLLCYSAVAAMVLVSRLKDFNLWIFRGSSDEGTNRNLQYLRLVLLVLFAIFLINGFAVKYFPKIMSPPRVDIGYTTVQAAELFLNEMQNPYMSQEINIRPELKPEFRGFHYGPLMFISYFPALIFPVFGYKMMSVIFILASSLLLCILVQKKENTLLDNIESAVFALILFFLSNRFWYENFTQGANDIFPVMLILASLLCIQRDNFLLAGLFAGLSFSAKFSPALFLFVFFIRRDYRENFFYGWLLGLLPIFAFIIWDPAGLLNNVFLCRMTLKFDSTSLYSITPEKLHYIFSLGQIMGLIAIIALNFNKRLVFDSLLAQLILLLILVEVCFKEIHANHFIWFIPLVAVYFSRCLTGARRRCDEKTSASRQDERLEHQPQSVNNS